MDYARRMRSLTLGWLAAAGVAQAIEVRLAWDPPKVVNSYCTAPAGYVVRYGTRSGEHPLTVDVRSRRDAKISGLAETTTYYFVVAAYDSAGRLGDPSAEIVWTSPDCTPPEIAAPGLQIFRAGTNGWLELPDLRTLATVRDNWSEPADMRLEQTPPALTRLAPGEHLIKLTATDADGNAAACALPVRVLSPTTVGPVWLDLEDPRVGVGQTLEFPVQAVEFDGQPLALWALGLPAGAVFTDLGGGAGLLRWMPQRLHLGDHAVQFLASDGEHSDARTVFIHVSTFEVTEPVSAEVVRARGPLRVSWSGAEPLQTVDLDLWRGGERIMTLASGVAAPDPAMGWSAELPAGLPPGADYSVRVLNAQNPADYACSPRFSRLPAGFNDYNGDGRSDLALFYPGKYRWYVRDAADSNALSLAENWGFSGCVPVPGDYDGDGAYDLAVYDTRRAQWWIRSQTQNTNLAVGVNWGYRDCVPVPGDYDGDGDADLALYDPRRALWHIRSLQSGVALATNLAWGCRYGKPAPGDYDGDGAADLAVYDPNRAAWHVRSLAGATLHAGTVWGYRGALPVPADYDGDGKTELAVYRPGYGTWHICQPHPAAMLRPVEKWGCSSGVPIPGDYDGDGRADLAVYEPGKGLWHIRLTDVLGTSCRPAKWGNSSMKPVK